MDMNRVPPLRMCGRLASVFHQSRFLQIEKSIVATGHWGDKILVGGRNHLDKQTRTW